jgi:TM2 domain-containing membrane protein YozV
MEHAGKRDETGWFLMASQGSAGNVLSAICNVFFPGLGQLVQGRLLAAIIFAIVCVGGYALWFLVIPAIIAGIFHLWSIIDAATFQDNN